MKQIYLLKTPFGNYVGATRRGLVTRLSEHLCKMKSDSFHPLWPYRHKLKRSDVSIERIDVVHDRLSPEWLGKERHWIAFYKKIGGLLNKTDGGLGPEGRVVSKSEKAKHRASMKSRWIKNRTAMLDLVNAHKTKDFQSKAGKLGGLAKRNKQKYFIVTDKRNDSVLGRFNVQREAAKEFNITPSSMGRYLSGKMRHSRLGFEWEGSSLSL